MFCSLYLLFLCAVSLRSVFARRLKQLHYLLVSGEQDVRKDDVPLVCPAKHEGRCAADSELAWPPSPSRPPLAVLTSETVTKH